MQVINKKNKKEKKKEKKYPNLCTLVFPFAVVWRELGTVFFVELNASRVTGSRFPAVHARYFTQRKRYLHV